MIGEAESLRVMVYEHVSSGGFSGEPLPAEILSEGFAMLRAVSADFQTAGHNVTVLLDSRLAAFNPPLKANKVTVVFSAKEIDAFMNSASEFVDAALVIAPESNQILQSIVTRAEKSGLQSLNCSASSIEKVANKASMYKHAKQLGVHVPETLQLTTEDPIEKVAEKIQQKTRFPAVFKPLSGTSCTGLSLVRSPNQITAAIDKIKKLSTSAQFIVQQFVKGIAASVSLISTGHEALPVSLNKQYVTINTPEANSSYNGSEVPLDSPLKEAAFAVAKRVVESFGDLRGYVGVDLILTNDDVYVVDVNPRLTTSYIGLHTVTCFNPANALLNAALKGTLPKNTQTVGYSVFSKVTVPKFDASALSGIYKDPHIVSPPFPINTTNGLCSIVKVHGETLQEAQFKFHEAKEHLQRICHGGT